MRRNRVRDMICHGRPDMEQGCGLNYHEKRYEDGRWVWCCCNCGAVNERSRKLAQTRDARGPVQHRMTARQFDFVKRLCESETIDMRARHPGQNCGVYAAIIGMVNDEIAVRFVRVLNGTPITYEQVFIGPRLGKTAYRTGGRAVHGWRAMSGI